MCVFIYYEDEKIKVINKNLALLNRQLPKFMEEASTQHTE